MLNAGQVVEVPQSDYVSTASGGDQARSSHKKASSTSDVLDKTPPDFDSYALTWKVQVSDLQVAFLSTKLYGTAQFVADDCNISHSIKNATEYTDVRTSRALGSLCMQLVCNNDLLAAGDTVTLSVCPCAYFFADLQYFVAMKSLTGCTGYSSMQECCGGAGPIVQYLSKPDHMVCRRLPAMQHSTSCPTR